MLEAWRFRRNQPGLYSAQANPQIDDEIAKKCRFRTGTCPDGRCLRLNAILHQMKPEPPETTSCVLRTTLDRLLTTITSSAEKVLVGNDPDDIHDLRVATRRTRTLVGQVPGVFPREVTKPYRHGFKRIGIVTGDCRDLDVWLDAIEEHREASKAEDAIHLDLLKNLISHTRDTAREGVRNELAQPWFPDLLGGWRAFLHAPRQVRSSVVSLPLKTVATSRILKAHRRLIKHGRALPAMPSACQLHRLRIDGKKLRYLLEFFGHLFDANRCHALIADLKALQDVLSGINDREVQVEALAALAAQPSHQNQIMTLAIEHHRHFLNRSLRTFRSNLPTSSVFFRPKASARLLQRYSDQTPQLDHLDCRLEKEPPGEDYSRNAIAAPSPAGHPLTRTSHRVSSRGR